MWWNGDAFHCGSGPRGVVHFHDIFFKVPPLHCPHALMNSSRTACEKALLEWHLVAPGSTHFLHSHVVKVSSVLHCYSSGTQYFLS